MRAAGQHHVLLVLGHRGGLAAEQHSVVRLLAVLEIGVLLGQLVILLTARLLLQVQCGLGPTVEQPELLARATIALVVVRVASLGLELLHAAGQLLHLLG